MIIFAENLMHGSGTYGMTKREIENHQKMILDYMTLSKRNKLHIRHVSAVVGFEK